MLTFRTLINNASGFVMFCCGVLLLWVLLQQWHCLSNLKYRGKKHAHGEVAKILLHSFKILLDDPSLSRNWIIETTRIKETSLSLRYIWPPNSSWFAPSQWSLKTCHFQETLSVLGPKDFAPPGIVLRWLRGVFQSQYLPSLSINYVSIDKDLENYHHSCIR